VSEGGWGEGAHRSCLSLARVSWTRSRPSATCSLKPWMNSLDFLFWSIRCCSMVAGLEEALRVHISWESKILDSWLVGSLPPVIPKRIIRIILPGSP
jgi:hypothetical protein